MLHLLFNAFSTPNGCRFSPLLYPRGRRIHPHPLFEALAYCVAFRVYLYLRRRFGDAISTPLRWAAVAFALAGAAIGSKIVYWLEDPRLTWSHLRDPAYLMGGKTMVGALVFGLVFVEVIKRYVSIKQSTGDLYAIPLAFGIAIGRIGCFLTGLADNTYGVATGLPWGVDFGDGIRRHPTQLYEIVFLLALIPLLYRIMLAVSRSTTKEQRTMTVFCMPLSSLWSPICRSGCCATSSSRTRAFSWAWEEFSGPVFSAYCIILATLVAGLDGPPLKDPQLARN